MAVEHIEFLVEELSMETFLQKLLPRILHQVTFHISAFPCKDALLKRLPQRLRGYAACIPNSWRIVVIVDRDDDDCYRLKDQLEQFAHNAGLVTRSAATGSSYTVVNRLAIEELESWYFGDPAAVRAAYPKVPATLDRKRGFRNRTPLPAERGKPSNAF